MAIYIFDKDGTICQSKSGQAFINSADDQELISGVKSKIDSLKKQGHLIAVISNQGGVSFGYMSYMEAESIVKHAADMIGAFNYEMCPFHPDGIALGFTQKSNRRKPNPGMILDTVDLVQRDKIMEVVYIGDRPEDEMALKNAKIARPDINFKFYWAKDFFDEKN